MKIATIGRGTIGGTVAGLRTSVGHEVTELGREGGDASDADAVLFAVPNQAVSEALAALTGLQGKLGLDATNRLSGEAPPIGYPSIAEYVKATTNEPVAKAFNRNYGSPFDQAARVPPVRAPRFSDGTRRQLAQRKRRDMVTPCPH
jgi:8-hydroxy-5-deazaflavin:NADPH oxidoreductase